MRRLLTGATVLMLAGLVSAGDADLEALKKKAAGFLSEVAAAMRSINDKASAQAALPKFEALYDKGEAVDKQLEELKPAQLEQVTQSTEMVAQNKALLKEMTRLHSLPEAKPIIVVLQTSKFFKQRRELLQNPEDVKIEVAKIHIRTLEAAALAYRIKNSEFPPNLETLSQKENGGPYLENTKALRDPWGKAYQYDVTGPRNKGKQPDIWTVTPQKEIIGNWMKFKKKS